MAQVNVWFFSKWWTGLRSAHTPWTWHFSIHMRFWNSHKMIFSRWLDRLEFQHTQKQTELIHPNGNIKKKDWIVSCVNDVKVQINYRKKNWPSHMAHVNNLFFPRSHDNFKREKSNPLEILSATIFKKYPISMKRRKQVSQIFFYLLILWIDKFSYRNLNHMTTILKNKNENQKKNW